MAAVTVRAVRARARGYKLVPVLPERRDIWCSVREERRRRREEDLDSPLDLRACARLDETCHRAGVALRDRACVAVLCFVAIAEDRDRRACVRHHARARSARSFRRRGQYKSLIPIQSRIRRLIQIQIAMCALERSLSVRLQAPGLLRVRCGRTRPATSAPALGPPPPAPA